MQRLIELKPQLLLPLLIVGVVLISTWRVAAQTLADYSPTADTYLDKTNPTSNFGAAASLNVQGHSNNFERPLLAFDLSSIPSRSTIVSASLNLYFFAATSDDAMLINTHVVTATWDELQATWKQRVSGLQWITLGGDYNLTVLDSQTITNSFGWVSWSVTAAVQDWVNGTLPNDGFILEAPSDSITEVKQFHSRECGCGFQP